MKIDSSGGCAGLAGVAAELALGALTGRERAEALAHVGRCEACREDVCRLTMAAEALLELLPARDPPPGFHTRVLERLELSSSDPVMASRAGLAPHLRRRPGNRQRTPGLNRRVLSGAVAVAVAAAGLGGWGIRLAMTPVLLGPLSSAALTSPGHRTVGEIFAYAGSPGWLYISVDSGSWNGTVVCTLVDKDGRVTTAGSFPLADGYGSWGSQDSADNAALNSARLVAPDGTVLATARFARA